MKEEECEPSPGLLCHINKGIAEIKQKLMEEHEAEQFCLLREYLHCPRSTLISRWLDLWLHTRRLSTIPCTRAAAQWAQGRDQASLVWLWRRRDSTRRQQLFLYSYSLFQAETLQRMQGLSHWLRKAMIPHLFPFSNPLPTSLFLSRLS